MLCSIGLDGHGGPLNINADEAASDVAKLLNASNLMLLTDVPGVLDGQGEVIDEMTAAEVEHRIAEGEITGGMIPKVRGAVAAANAAHIPSIISSWREPEALVGTSGSRWRGTRIMPEHHAAPGQPVELLAASHGVNS